MRKAPFTPYHLEMRTVSLASTEEVSQLSTSSSKEASLNNSYVTGTLNLLNQEELTPRCPDSKLAWISLHWL